MEFKLTSSQNPPLSRLMSVRTGALRWLGSSLTYWLAISVPFTPSIYMYNMYMYTHVHVHVHVQCKWERRNIHAHVHAYMYTYVYITYNCIYTPHAISIHVQCTCMLSWIVHSAPCKLLHVHCIYGKNIPAYTCTCTCACMYINISG